MVKISVIYATKTKHSKKLADAIALALNVRAENIKENPLLNNTDLLFIVGGIYGGVSMPELLEFIKRLDAPTIKQAAIITSCASGKKPQTAVRSLLEEKRINIIDEFICKGAILFVSVNHPNKKDLHEATDFAQKIVSCICM